MLEGGAAASETAGFLRDVIVATVAAAGGGLAARVLRQPLVVGYLAAGVVVGPQVLHLVQDRDRIELISEIGLLFLLFLVGLEIEPHRLVARGWRPALVGLLQVPACAAVAWVVLGALPLPGLVGDMVGVPASRLLLAIALAVPSAEIITKVLADRHELSTPPGRITRAALVAKSLYVLATFALLPAFPHTLDPAELWKTGLGALGTLGTCALVGRVVLPFVFRLLWRSPDLVLIVAIGWGFGLAGAAQWLGLSMEMGALLAGIALSTHQVGAAIAVRLRSLRDFFHTLFFVAIGMSLAWPYRAEQIGIGVTLGLILASRVVTVAPLVLLSRGDRRTAVTSTLHLAQMSVFSLVLVTLAEHHGLAPKGLRADVLTPVYALAAVLTTYALAFSPRIERAVERSLSTSMIGPVRPIFLLGCHRTGSTLLAELARAPGGVGQMVHVVDWNLDAHRALTDRGIACTYGDLADPETLERAGLKHAAIIVITIEDETLRGTDNAFLVRAARRLAPKARIVALATERADIRRVSDAGADEVMSPRAVLAHDLAKRILGAMAGDPARVAPRLDGEVID